MALGYRQYGQYAHVGIGKEVTITYKVRKQSSTRNKDYAKISRNYALATGGRPSSPPIRTRSSSERENINKISKFWGNEVTTRRKTNRELDVENVLLLIEWFLAHIGQLGKLGRTEHSRLHHQSTLIGDLQGKEKRH